MTKLIAGMDLHSNNVVIGLMDMDGKRVAHQKVECRLSEVVRFLSPFKKRLEQVAVESTYNWYWLVDGLRFDRAVSQKRVGLGGLATGAEEPKLLRTE